MTGHGANRSAGDDAQDDRHSHSNQEGDEYQLRQEHEHGHSHAADREEAMDRGVHARLIDESEQPGQLTAGHNEHNPDSQAAVQRMASDAHVGHAAQAMHSGAQAAQHRARGHSAHVDHTGHETLFRQRFWVSLVLSIPVLVYSPMIQDWLGFTPPAFPGSQWITPVLSTVIFLYGGLPFLQMAGPELRNRQPGMMTLISLAISVAFAYSIASLFLPGQESFFWELVTLIDIMLLGHWLEMRSVRQASGALDALAKLMPDTAERILPNGVIEEVRVDQLRPGDLVLVRPGASLPVDGEVVEGESEVNEAMVTGESRPAGKRPSDRVIGGTLNGDGSLRVRVTATGEQTALAGIMRLVTEAQQSKSRTQVLADRAAGWLFYVALGVALLTAIAWTVATGFGVEVVERVATVLVIACPHALGLAIPLVVAITTGLGARNGILVRDRLALERAREIDTVIFDKTGTLTRGEFGVIDIETADGWSDSMVLALAAVIEGDSEHSIARGIRRAAEDRGLKLPAISNFEAMKGRGVRARSNGATVYLGGPRMLEWLDPEIPAGIKAFETRANTKGDTAVYLIQDGGSYGWGNGHPDRPRVVAGFALADVVRPESRAAVDRLHDMGIQVAMLTGDAEAVAATVAAELGIDRYFAQVLPEHKDQKVAELQAQGRRVAMVGDGVNDAPALARADVGIAIGSGTDVAVQSAGIILVKSDPMDAVKAIELSRASYRKMIQNLAWATGYNVIALPLAAGILAPAGIVLSPAMGAVLMSVSTIIVAFNAQLLRGLRLGQ